MAVYRDPHVAMLRYTLALDERFHYENPPSVQFETNEARFKLADGQLSCELIAHFPDEDSARKVVGGIIEAWQAIADLKGTVGQLRFQFDGAEIIDRNPLPGAVEHGDILLSSVAVMGLGRVELNKRWANYPEPPGSFRLNPDADTLVHRYRMYVDGRESLFSMAYFCFTVLKVVYAGKAHKELNIDPEVLRTIRLLTTNRGGRDARKRTLKPQPPLSPAEQGWLEAAIKRLILRLGDTNQLSALPKITLADLPPL